MFPPSSPLRLLNLASLLLVTLCPFGAVAAESRTEPTFLSTQPHELKIVDGGIPFLKRAGKPVPATVREIVGLLQDEYPSASISIVGVGDVRIENVTLRIAPRTGALRAALVALAEASGRKFRLQDVSDQDFVLSPERSPAGNRIAEVFNLGPLLFNHATTQLERRLREMETDLAAVRKVKGPDDPHVAGIKTDIAIAKARLAEAGAAPDGEAIIKNIEAVVSATLRQLKSGETPPEFSFHPGTKLLIVVGADEAIEVTRKVVAALEKGGAH